MAFVDRQVIGHPVAPDAQRGDAGGDHDLAQAGFLGGVEHVPRALNVGFEIVLVAFGIAVVDAGQVNHGVLAGQGRAHAAQIENVGLDVGHVLAGYVLIGRLDVQHAGRADVGQLVDDEAAQQAAAAGHDHAFETHPILPSTAGCRF